MSNGIAMILFSILVIASWILTAMILSMKHTTKTDKLVSVALSVFITAAILTVVWL